MKRSKIGILYLNYGKKFFVSHNYEKFAKKFGTPVGIMYNEYKEVDMLILPGGADVSPHRYNQKPSIFCDPPDPYLEYFDTYILPKYMKERIPIFGICRGHQTFAVANGCSLIQHVNHRVSSYHIPYTERVNKIPVNSFHHQIVKEVPEKLGTVALSDVYNTIEAVEYKKYPAITVQWHPEQIYDVYSMDAVSMLLK